MDKQQIKTEKICTFHQQIHPDKDGSRSPEYPLNLCMNISTELSKDIWHDLQEPGSYEWWYFDADDQEQGISLVCIWFAGFAFSPYYMQHYLDWKRNRTLDPPRALDYSGFSFQLYENGRESVNFIKEGPSSFFTSDGSALDVSFENNRFYYDQAQQSYILDIAFEYPARRQKVTAKLLFEVTYRYSWEKCNNADDEHAPRHEWLLSLPGTEVTGQVIVEDTLKHTSHTHVLRARGYHDHNLGRMPVHEYIDTWYWGRAFSGKYDLVYYIIFFRNSRYSPLAFGLLHDSGTGNLTIYEDLQMSKSGLRRGLFAPVHSKHLRLSRDALCIDIQQMQVLDSGPFYLRYNSRISFQEASRETASFRGISEFLKPGRLQLPVLRFFTRCRVWRDGKKSAMYDRYNALKTYLHRLKR